MSTNNMGNLSIASSIIKPPCEKNCQNREVGCHAKCELYSNYVEEKNKIKAQIDKHREATENFVDHKKTMCYRMSKHKNIVKN